MSSPTRALLNRSALAAVFSFADHAPSADLAAFVETHWAARWDLPVRYTQGILPCPSINLVIGTYRPGVHGVTSTRRLVPLEGAGWAVGTRLRPGALRAFAGHVDVSAMTDRVVPFVEVFGDAGRALDAAVRGAPSETEQLAAMEAFLRARKPRVDAEMRRVARLVELAKITPSVAALAAHAGVSVRALERLFRTSVGVGPKAVIRRQRIQLAHDLASTGEPVDWAGVARFCGYFDQAHMIRDFKEQVGQTPQRYARRQVPLDPSARKALPPPAGRR